MPEVKTKNLSASHEKEVPPSPKLSEVQLGGFRFSARLSLGNHLAFSIQEDSIQMAVVRQMGWKQTIVNLTKIYIPQALTKGKEYDNFICKEIDTFVQEFGGRNPRISVTVSGPETAFRRVILPKMKKKEIASAIEFEARRQLPFPISDCHYDYRTISRIIEDSQPRLKVSLLAATSRLVHERIAPFRRLNLKVSHVYHMRDVVGQLLSRLPDFDINKSYALINIEQNRSEISFYRGTNLEFSHIISLGTSFLSDRGDATVFEYFAESLATEIQNSLDYYSGQFSNTYNSQVFVYGDLAYSDTLVGFLGNRFGFDFQRFPTNRIDVGRSVESDIEESFPVCLSAAAAALNFAALPNLLPQYLKERIKRQRLDKYSIATLSSVFVFLIVALLINRSQVSSLRNEHAALSRQVESFRHASLFDTYSLLKRRIKSDQKFLSLVQKKPSFMGLNLKELSQLTPVSVRLYNLDYRSDVLDRNMNIYGVVTSRNIPPEIILAEYVAKLSNSPFYEDVAVTRHTKKKVRGQFELDFQVAMKGAL